MVSFPSDQTSRTGSTLEASSEQRIGSASAHAREWDITVLGEHDNEDVEHYRQLGLVKRRQLDEHIAGIQVYFGMIRVDDGRQGQDLVILVVPDWVDWRILDDVQVSCQVFLRL